MLEGPQPVLVTSTCLTWGLAFHEGLDGPSELSLQSGVTLLTDLKLFIPLLNFFRGRGGTRDADYDVEEES